MPMLNPSTDHVANSGATRLTRPYVTPRPFPSAPPAIRPRAAGEKAPSGIKVPAAAKESASEIFIADLARQMVELRGYAKWLCGSSALAEDLVQDTLLKAWAARDRFEPGTNLKAWCMTILRNIYFSYKRRSWRSLALPDETIEALTAECAEAGDLIDLLAVRNAIALLPREQREALLLIGVGGLKYIDAAEVCGCAVGTLKSRVSRARLRLAALMSDNKAGFSSDANLGAGEALNDLLDQVTRIKARMNCPKRAERRTATVLSESG